VAQTSFSFFDWSTGQLHIKRQRNVHQTGAPKECGKKTQNSLDYRATDNLTESKELIFLILKLSIVGGAPESSLTFHMSGR